jgi:hypothetical protein
MLHVAVASWLRISRQPISPKVVAALQAFTNNHPQVHCERQMLHAYLDAVSLCGASPGHCDGYSLL